jgi:hypothetical protein
MSDSEDESKKEKEMKFLKKTCTIHDHYSDGMITDLVNKQKSYGEKEKMPWISLFLDDILGSLKRNNEASWLGSRFRHYNIGLYFIAVQHMKAVDTVLRNNATDVIIFRQSNMKSLEQLGEEYCSMFGNKEKFYEIYRIATRKKYDFLYLKIYEGKALRSFEEVLWDQDTDLHNEPNIPDKEIKEKKENKDILEKPCVD